MHNSDFYLKEVGIMTELWGSGDEAKSHCVVQAGFETIILLSCLLSAGITGLCYLAWVNFFFLSFYTED